MTMSPAKAPSSASPKARIKSLLLTPVGTVASVFDAERTYALTFDDGPHPDVTPRMLDLLRDHGAKATFFVLTDYIARDPALLQRMLDEGHEVGLHFDRHDRIPDLAPQAALRRLRDARDLLARAGRRPTLFRPPYGSQSYLTYAMARSLGLKVIGWSRQANDWIEQSPESAAASAADGLAAGDIILLHDGLELRPDETVPMLDRVRVLELILTKAERERLKSVTVTDLLVSGRPRQSHWFR